MVPQLPSRSPLQQTGPGVRTTMSDHLFSGLKVIDCASWIAGPAAATIMSDFGADVIKIEPPGVGDPWRGRSLKRARRIFQRKHLRYHRIHADLAVL